MPVQDYFVAIKPQQLVVRTHDDQRQFSFRHFDARGVSFECVVAVVERVHHQRQEAEAQMYSLFAQSMFPTQEEAIDSARAFLQKTNPIGRIRTYKHGRQHSHQQY